MKKIWNYLVVNKKAFGALSVLGMIPILAISIYWSFHGHSINNELQDERILEIQQLKHDRDSIQDLLIKDIEQLNHYIFKADSLALLLGKNKKQRHDKVVHYEKVQAGIDSLTDPEILQYFSSGRLPNQ